MITPDSGGGRVIDSSCMEAGGPVCSANFDTEPGHGWLSQFLDRMVLEVCGICFAATSVWQGLAEPRPANNKPK